MKIHNGFMHFHFDGQLLGCNWIKVKIPLWLFDINNDVITIRPGWYRIAHNVQKIIVKASRCLDTGKIINACCHTIC